MSRHLRRVALRFLRLAASPTQTPRDESSDGTDAGGPVSYLPELDGAPDPGEVVWAWVPYDDDPSQGKDRPVLLMGREGLTLLGLQMTSKDHDRDAADEARHGRHWVDIGAGDWDSRRRPSEVRLDRLLRLDEQTVRREGAVLDQGRFEMVVRAASTHHDLGRRTW